MKLPITIAFVCAFLFLPQSASAASCSSDNCSNASIQSILVDWNALGSTPYTVKVRFDSLTGLNCNYQGSTYNEVVLWSNDPAFQTKYSALMTAFTLGKPVSFYVRPAVSSEICTLRSLILY